jgi:uncharacterized 2Fe-2S/4Fe-4S cluster protein (DUF4445 family)
MDSPMCSGCVREAVEVVCLEVGKPSSVEVSFDSLRVLEAFSEFIKEPVKIPLYVLRKLPYELRKKNFKIWTVLGKKEKEWEILEISSEPLEKALGIAIDLGSTTIAFYVYDFLKKEVLQKFSIVNPQVVVGEDILTRLHFARKEENLKYLQKITVDAINKELEKISKSEIYYLTICGNTVMSHFLAGLPVRYIFGDPPCPCTKEYGVFEAKELGLEAHPCAKVFIFPSVGAYFGGDIIAGLYFSEIYKKEGYYFFIDVGTNAEVVLGNRDFLLVTSGAAGPALEGGIFECGCQAKEGAIYSVVINSYKEELQYFTLNNKAPVGICGSGIIDLIAQLFINGLLSNEGKFIKKSFHNRFKKIDDELAFIVAFAEETAERKLIYIKESEIKSFLRSKGAMYAILRVLCEKVGLSFNEIEKFYIAGTFGNHIRVESAVTLGMLPEEALEKTEGLGNAAGEGALKFLQKPEFSEIEDILKNITYLDLNKDPRFMEIFAGARFLGRVYV